MASDIQAIEKIDLKSVRSKYGLNRADCCIYVQEFLVNKLIIVGFIRFIILRERVYGFAYNQ